MRDGVHGGSNSALYQRWAEEDADQCHSFPEGVHSSLSLASDQMSYSIVQ
jgi:hypothetical protein